MTAPLARLALLGSIAAMLAASAQAQSVEDLRNLSLDELANVNVSSVSKSSEALGDAAAAVYVITHDDIVRSGATTIPEILRLAPNLEVFQQSASHYLITARGLIGNQADQNFPNKLLVLVDGRSVYTPLYSGVYWDMQDVPPDDIDRIEVISGPGATLWGANAVNGVINIITRHAGETQGLLTDLQAGAREQVASARYGGHIGDNIAIRAYVRGLHDDETETSAGKPAADNWWRVSGGFQLDWTPTATDMFTLQGDVLNLTEDQLGAGDEISRGRNLLARWTRTENSGGALEIQAYYDRSGRDTLDDGGEFSIDTYDLYVQHSTSPNAKNDFVWGGGVRASRFNINGNASLFFEPPRRTLLLANAFAQYGLAVTPRLKLTLGFKVERDPYVGASALPNVRLAWKPASSVLVWTAVSRAVRSPTPFDRDVMEVSDGKLFVTGDKDFQTEKLTAFEAGTRIQATARASLSVSTYYNIYDDLRSIEPTPTVFLPIHWGNGLKGSSYGVEAWGDYALTNWWKLSAGIDLLHEDYRFKPGASGLLGVTQLGDDPRRQAMVRSSINIGRAITIDADFRYVGPLPDPYVPHYVELGGSIAWHATDRIQLSVSGLNLLHAWHQEFTPDSSNRVPRTIFAGLKWRF